MITVDISTALLLYFAFFLILCFGTWLFSHLKYRKKETLPPLYDLISCEYCTFTYLSSFGKEISKCPNCSSFNKMHKFTKLAEGFNPLESVREE